MTFVSRFQEFHDENPLTPLQLRAFALSFWRLFEQLEEQLHDPCSYT